jgi:LacI family transcriptional regulator
MVHRSDDAPTDEVVRVGNLKLSDVALKAKVSAATASRVLNGHQELVSPSTYRRVLKVIKELGYKPTPLGRALRQGHSNMVALLLPDIQNPFYSAIASSIEQSLQTEDISLVLCNVGEDPAIQDDVLRQVRGFRTRCILMLGAVDSPGLREAVRQGERLVFVNRRPPDDLKGTFVGINNQRAGGDVARMLHEQGARRFGVMRGPMHSSASRDRFTGFSETLRLLGCKLRTDMVWDNELSIQSGWELGAKVLAKVERLDAVFCGNDLIAYGLHRRLVENGVRVPHDLVIVGFDDTPLNRWLAPWLTSVRVPYESFGVTVRELMREPTSTGPREIILEHRLVERARVPELEATR